MVVGGRPERRELAHEFGAAPGDGEGADVVIEAVGTAEAWQDALRLVRPGGTVLFFGGRELGVDTFRLHYEELTLKGAFHHTPRHIRSALAFLASGAFRGSASSRTRSALSRWPASSPTRRPTC